MLIKYFFKVLKVLITFLLNPWVIVHTYSRLCSFFYHKKQQKEKFKRKKMPLGKFVFSILHNSNLPAIFVIASETLDFAWSFLQQIFLGMNPSVMTLVNSQVYINIHLKFKIWCSFESDYQKLNFARPFWLTYFNNFWGSDW